ncbi:MAG TPA: ATP-binding protein [Bryobacteraceae bacterium]|nr:ATP-binding protein [Bryobacteraceae bacterium]
MDQEPYRDSIEHLRDELLRVDLMLRRALLIARLPKPESSDSELRGLIITEPEVDDMIRVQDYLGEWWRRETAAKDQIAPIEKRLEELRENIDQRRAATVRAGGRLTLPYLSERFGLSPAEVDLVLIALAPELEVRYETLYAYLHDDVTRKRPSLDLILNLICRNEREKIFARRLVSPGSPLMHFKIIELIDDVHDRQPSLLRKFVKVDDAVVRYLLEQPPSVLAAGTLITPRATVDTIEVGADTRLELSNLVKGLERSAVQNTIVRLAGPLEPRLFAAAEALSHALGRRLFHAELGGIEAHGPTLVRDSALLDATLAISASDYPEDPVEAQQVAKNEARLWKALAESGGPLLLLGPSTAFHSLPAEARIWRVEIGAPGYDFRRQAWQQAVSGMTEDADPNRLADTFQFGSQRIVQTSNLAWSLAALRNPSDPSPNMNDLLEAGRVLTAPHLRRFAVPVEPRFTWSDLVLPPDRMAQLKAIASRVQFRPVVHRDWGFGDKLSRGKGLTVLFTGPPGTGKTTAAEVLANELALNLFQIDLSTVVSKYIGETEKHLSVIFQEAEMTQSLLFFDEADSLFSKRTEVKDAHDRYANMEVNYLLQRIEQYQGLVVLSTNMQRNVDEAFIRRMQEVVEFPFPDENLREQIWRLHFPEQAPRSEDIDFVFLARQFKFPGGTIKNAVINAAFLAAGQNRAIQMSDIIQAVKSELQKQGKLALKNDFGKYFEVLQGTR